MTQLRRGHANTYTPTHKGVINPSHTGWVGLCGRCGVQISGERKKHPIFGQVCKAGCKR